MMDEDMVASVALWREQLARAFNDSNAFMQVMRDRWRADQIAADNRRVMNSPAERMKIRETVCNHEQYDAGPFLFQGTLDAVMASLQGIRESIPEEFRATATCEIDSAGSYEDSHYAQITVEYDRPETDEEYTTRLANREELLAARKQQQEKAEREQWERLSIRFGTPSPKDSP